MPQHHVVVLTPAQRRELAALLTRDATPARQQRRARVLLHADRGPAGPKRPDAEVAAAVGCDPRTVARVRAEFAAHGLERALCGAPPAFPDRRTLDGAAEARLVALACSPAPDGRARWSLRLLAARAVELEIAPALSRELVRRALKKNELQPWRVRRWVIPPAADAAFAAAMEDVLDAYAAPPDPRRPLVCFDEAGTALTAHTRLPQPVVPGRPTREDYEYARRGSANLFLAVAPHLGWRSVAVTERRTAVDVARALRDLVDAFPAAERIVLVLDNLNVHRPSSLYHAFPPAEARRVAAKLEWHYTPRHGSWLNIAELEVSALQRQRLRRRIPDRATLAAEVAAWAAARNADRAGVDWRFTSAEARDRLDWLYPVPPPAPDPATMP